MPPNPLTRLFSQNEAQKLAAENGYRRTLVDQEYGLKALAIKNENMWADRALSLREEPEDALALKDVGAPMPIVRTTPHSADVTAPLALTNTLGPDGPEQRKAATDQVKELLALARALAVAQRPQRRLRESHWPQAVARAPCHQL